MRYFFSLLGAVACFVALAFAADSDTKPEFTKDGQLKRPANYREWIYLSSGLGMTYGPNATEPANPNFDNVFVEPSAYRNFLQTGRWQEGSMFALEIRRAQTKGSINKAGRFQGAQGALEVEVKDSKRFSDGWGYFGFNGGAQTASALGPQAGCNSCHSQNAAVEHTFVQFYPTLIDVARAKGTLNASYVKAESEGEAH
jgi:hypothetical protein